MMSFQKQKLLRKLWRSDLSICFYDLYNITVHKTLIV